MASGKKTSKNQKSGTKGKVMIQEKRVKPKKEELLIEMTQEVVQQLFEEEKDGELTKYYKGHRIIKIERRFGKNYLRIENV